MHLLIFDILEAIVYNLNVLLNVYYNLQKITTM